MADRSRIEWTDATWQPIRGCTRVSKGCENCYAERQAIRLAGPGRPYAGLVRSTPNGPRWTGKLRFDARALEKPLQWRKKRKIFTCSMGDLFHEDVPEHELDAVWAVMALADRHCFQVLTKRPERARKYLNGLLARARVRTPRLAVASYAGWFDDDRVAQVLEDALRRVRPDLMPARPGRGERIARRFPLYNVWLGTSVEDQATADERIPLLLQAPAAVRWVSYEPALGPVDFTLVRMAHGGRENVLECGVSEFAKSCGIDKLNGIDWIVVGGESGAGARPFDVAWARSTIAQCRAAEVPVFVKQLGAVVRDDKRNADQWVSHSDASWLDYLEVQLCDRKGGDPAEWPEDLRVRQFPRPRVPQGATS